MDDDFGLLSEKEKAFVDSFTEKIRTQERERIIELVKSSIRECQCGGVGMTYCRHNSTQTDLIALIKGEN